MEITVGFVDGGGPSLSELGGRPIAVQSIIHPGPNLPGQVKSPCPNLKWGIPRAERL